MSSTGRLNLTLGVESSTKNRPPWWGDYWTDTLLSSHEAKFPSIQMPGRRCVPEGLEKKAGGTLWGREKTRQK